MREIKHLHFLITGANGFVGKVLCAELSHQGFSVRAAVRSLSHISSNYMAVAIGDLDGQTSWKQAVDEIDVVIHLAARVHVMDDTSTDPLTEFRKVNVAGTEHLARSAAACGVKRFVYVSSIKVNGESTEKGKKFLETDIPNPQDPYGLSKWEAEQALHRVAAETGLEVVIVRPPLIYGPRVKGNFAQMLKVLAKGIPLPLASVHNLRSLIYIENFVDALILCATHPAAAGQTYLVNDGEDVSTPDLLRQLGISMGHPAHLLPCPTFLIRLAGRLTGKAAQIDRLLGSLQVDGSKIRRDLGWSPPFTLQQGLSFSVNSRTVNQP